MIVSNIGFIFNYQTNLGGTVISTTSTSPTIVCTTSTIPTGVYLFSYLLSFNEDSYGSALLNGGISTVSNQNIYTNAITRPYSLYFNGSSPTINDFFAYNVTTPTVFYFVVYISTNPMNLKISNNNNGFLQLTRIA